MAENVFRPPSHWKWLKLPVQIFVQSSLEKQRNHKLLCNFQAKIERNAETREISQHRSRIVLMALTTKGDKIKVQGPHTVEILVKEALLCKLGLQRTTTSENSKALSAGWVKERWASICCCLTETMQNFSGGGKQDK